ncbi:MAG: hypothetical protein RLY50_900 [Actinomycetota bacterium]
MTPRRFRVASGVALGSLCVIVLTGALVRLTGSGLGCVDWPRCNESKFVDVSSSHTAIEQLNRLFTGVVSASVIAAVLLAHRLRPRRRDLIWLAWSLVVGVVVQVVIGGIVVLTGLSPFSTMAHFLVSMVLVSCAMALYRRSGSEEHSAWWSDVPSGATAPMRGLLVLMPTVIVTGTVVTASGPNAGDETAVRFGFALTSVARVHGITVVLTIACLVWAAWVAMGGGDTRWRESLQTVLFVAVLQAAVGWTQYFTGVPAALVAVHIAGATGLWLAWCSHLLVPATVTDAPESESAALHG